MPDVLSQLQRAANAAAVETEDDVPQPQTRLLGRTARADITDVDPSGSARPIFSGDANPAGLHVAVVDERLDIGGDLVDRIDQGGIAGCLPLVDCTGRHDQSCEQPGEPAAAVKDRAADIAGRYIGGQLDQTILAHRIDNAPTHRG